MDQTRLTRRIPRACQNCAKRKVKCNGDPDRCQQCSHLNLKCSYAFASPSKKSRSHVVRGSVISRLKDGDTAPLGNQNAALTNLIDSPPAPLAGNEGSSRVAIGLDPCPYSKDFFRDLVQPYDDHVYCVNPIITATEILESIERMDGDIVDFSLVHAFAAVTLNLTTPHWKSNPQEVARITDLVDRASSARSKIMSSCIRLTGDGVGRTLNERFIMTAIFLEICLMSFDRIQEAFLILREAISMIQLLNIHHPTEQASPDTHLAPASRTRRIRLYWEAYIHERFLAIIAYFPTTLSPLPPEVDLPTEDASVPSNVHEGFRGLIQLFSVLDTDFVKNWTASDRSGVTAEWIESKRLQLESLHLLSSDTDSAAGSPGSTVTDDANSLTTLQRADLIITRQWMLTLLWQLAISNCLLPSHAAPTSPGAMSLQFPVRLSQQLRHVVIQLGRQSIERHGSGIVQKLFEITNTFADVIIHVPVASLDQDAQRKNDFGFLFDFLSAFPALNKTQENILSEKAALVSKS